jgi:hypothetical protein
MLFAKSVAETAAFPVVRQLCIAAVIGAKIAAGDR